MKRHVFTVLLYWLVAGGTIVVLSLCAASLSYGTISDCHDATCRITAGEARGTGCVFEVSQGYVFVLTNAHVVGNSQQVQCEFWFKGHQSRPIAARVIYRNDPDVVDAAVVAVRVDAFGGHPPPAIPVAPRDTRLTVGQTITSVGCAKGSWATGWKGHVIGYANDDLHFLPSPANGRSGSALFDAEGERIVGLLRARTMDDREGIAVTVQGLHAAFSRQTQQCGPNCPSGGCGPLRGILGGGGYSRPAPGGRQPYTAPEGGGAYPTLPALPGGGEWHTLPGAKPGPTQPPIVSPPYVVPARRMPLAPIEQTDPPALPVAPDVKPSDPPALSNAILHQMANRLREQAESRDDFIRGDGFKAMIGKAISENAPSPWSGPLTAGLVALGMSTAGASIAVWLARRGAKRIIRKRNEDQPDREAGGDGRLAWLSAIRDLKAELKRPSPPAEPPADRLEEARLLIARLNAKVNDLDRRTRTAPAAEEPANPFPERPPRERREAEELVRLSQLEGRDPLHDGLLGLFVHDEARRLIEAGGPEGVFAKNLMDTLEARFNETMPFKLTPTP